MARKVKPRLGPRISFSKLIEYTVARSASRRRAIVRDQASPPDFLVAQYRRAKPVLVRAIRLGLSASDLEEVVGLLQQEHPKSSWAQRDLRNSIEAIERFRKIEGLNDGTLRLFAPTRSGEVAISGVTVSVAPDLIVRRTDSTGLPIVGAVKLHFAKTKELQFKEQAGRTAATLLRHFLESRMPASDFVVDPDLCFVWDVFGDTTFTAPKAFKRRMQDLTDSCAEIAKVWPHPDGGAFDSPDVDGPQPTVN